MICDLLSSLEFPWKPQLQKSRWIHLLLGMGVGGQGVWTGVPQRSRFLFPGSLGHIGVAVQWVVVG